MKFSVTILGNNSAIPTLRRNPTAQIVNHREKLFMVDCGEGAQIQMRKNRIRMQKVHHIFISHLHGDHFFGLIGLISSMHLMHRNKTLHVYGPPELKEILKVQLEVTNTSLVFKLEYHPLQFDGKESLYEDQMLTVESFPLKHSIPTCGFLFSEKRQKRKIDKEAIASLELPVSAYSRLKDGEDIRDGHGRLHKNADLTTDPPHPRSYAYCSDTAYDENIIPWIRDADLLYHEATFLQEMAEAAADKFHSTAREAALIAKKAGVRKLLLGHYSNRYDDPTPLMEEAREVFPETVFSE